MDVRYKKKLKSIATYYHSLKDRNSFLKSFGSADRERGAPIHPLHHTDSQYGKRANAIFSGFFLEVTTRTAHGLDI